MGCIVFIYRFYIHQEDILKYKNVQSRKNNLGKECYKFAEDLHIPTRFYIIPHKSIVGAVTIPILPIRKLKLENLEELCLHSRACSVG